MDTRKQTAPLLKTGLGPDVLCQRTAPPGKAALMLDHPRLVNLHEVINGINNA
jgi:hypothetical protein